MTALRNELVELFRETADAHHRAFAANDGVDPDWPIWYAEHLQRPLSEIADMPFVRSRLIYCLMRADDEHGARAEDRDWAEFAADFFLECYGASEAPAEDALALYYLPSCPYCIRVLRAIDRLGLEVELRNISDSLEHREALMAARGRTTVPVLRIDSAAGTSRWMPESRDIVTYLEKTYGRQGR